MTSVNETVNPPTDGNAPALMRLSWERSPTYREYLRWEGYAKRWHELQTQPETRDKREDRWSA